MNKMNKMATSETKEKLNVAFRALRARGFIARQNFLCCGGCAGYKIAIDAEELVARGKKVEGGIFYHRQEGERLLAGANFYVHFSKIDSKKYGVLGSLPDVEIGKIIVREFTKAGLLVHWTGSADRAIQIIQ